MKAKTTSMLLGSVGLFCLALLFYSFTSLVADGWDVPAEAAKRENPVPADKESLQIGKTIYLKHCASCHGKEGLGDGPKAGELETECGDFSSEEFHEQSDGSLFYKTVEGRGDMPSFEKKIPDEEDVWHVVNYMRSLSE